MNVTFRDIRLDKGMSQEEMANFLGITQGTWSYWENGKTGISSQMARILQDKLGLTYFQIKAIHQNTVNAHKRN